MTIAIAWIRRLLDCEELVFTTDSRLSGTAFNFDACPKVLTLPRSDCAIAFAGETDHAYPMMHQVAFAFEAHAPLKRRSIDLPAAKTHALKIINSMAADLRPSAHYHGAAPQIPNADFLFGGYSWVRKEFLLWTITYSSKDAAYIAKPAPWIGINTNSGRVALLKRKARSFRPIGQIAIAGDQAPLAEDRLIAAIREKNAQNVMSKLDYEPFEIVRDMLRDPAPSHTIGGAPQVVKVYQYSDAAPLGTWWPDRAEGLPFLQGRRCFGFERLERFFLDPDTLMSARLPDDRPHEEHACVNADAADRPHQPGDD